jgi:hypothetical protein
VKVDVDERIAERDVDQGGFEEGRMGLCRPQPATAVVAALLNPALAAGRAASGRKACVAIVTAVQTI